MCGCTSLLRFCACQQRVLENVLFPVGNLKKTEVRQIAIDTGFADVAAKKEVYNLYNNDVGIL